MGERPSHWDSSGWGHVCPGHGQWGGGESGNRGAAPPGMGGVVLVLAPGLGVVVGGGATSWSPAHLGKASVPTATPWGLPASPPTLRENVGTSPRQRGFPLCHLPFPKEARGRVPGCAPGRQGERILCTGVGAAGWQVGPGLARGSRAVGPSSLGPPRWTPVPSAKDSDVGMSLALSVTLSTLPALGLGSLSKWGYPRSSS